GAQGDDLAPQHAVVHRQRAQLVQHLLGDPGDRTDDLHDVVLGTVTRVRPALEDHHRCSVPVEQSQPAGNGRPVDVHAGGDLDVVDLAGPESGELGGGEVPQPTREVHRGTDADRAVTWVALGDQFGGQVPVHEPVGRDL